MSDWNLKELRDLCKDKNRRYPREFIDSLYWRRQRAEIHAEEANRVWKELFSGSFTFGDERYTKAYFLYAAHAESCAHCLRSMVDLLAQIINLAVLNEGYTEDKVTIYRINDSIKDISTDLHKSIGLLIKDGSFEYLSAFSNINKHRKLVHCDFHAEYGDGNRNKSDVIFHSFSYNGKDYPKTWGSDIIGEYRIRIISLICSVGQSINEFIRIN